MTMIELLIVLVVVAILAAVALPSYQEAIHRGRRADAMAALSAIAQAQERWRANAPSYQDTLANLTGASSAASPKGYYALSLADVTGVKYTARATASSSSLQASDSQCQALILKVEGGRITYTSEAGGGSANGAPDPCWVQ